MSNLNGAIYAGFAQVGIKDDDDKRALYMRVASKPRLTVMSDSEKEAVVAELRRMGFKPALKRANGRAKLSGPYAGKLQALWIAAYNLGIVENRDDAALEAFVKRQTGIERERWLRYPDDAEKVIGALKGWIAREGGVDWSVGAIPDFARHHGYKVARAQWSKLRPAAAADFWKVVTDLVDVSEIERELTDANWIFIMNYLGKRIRQEMKAVAK